MLPHVHMHTNVLCRTIILVLAFYYADFATDVALAMELSKSSRQLAPYLCATVSTIIVIHPIFV